MAYCDNSPCNCMRSALDCDTSSCLYLWEVLMLVLLLSAILRAKIWLSAISAAILTRTQSTIRLQARSSLHLGRRALSPSCGTLSQRRKAYLLNLF